MVELKNITLRPSFSPFIFYFLHWPWNPQNKITFILICLMLHTILGGMRVCFRVIIITFMEAFHVPVAVLSVLYVCIHLILIAARL